MLSGYPFRMVQQTQQSLNSFIGLLGSLYQLPHPQIPDMPLASDPNLDITGFLYRSLEFLRKELSYSGSYKPNDSGASPDKLSDADERRSRIGSAIRDEPTVKSRRAIRPRWQHLKFRLTRHRPRPSRFQLLRAIHGRKRSRHSAPA